MDIKPKHKHVDSTGKCYFPYLNQWNPQTCNLLGLILQMVAAFSQEPPVYSKPPGVTHTGSSGQIRQPQPQPSQPYPNPSAQYSNPPQQQFSNPQFNNPQYPNPAAQYTQQYTNPQQQYPPQPVFVDPKTELVKKVSQKLQTQLESLVKSLTNEASEMMKIQSELSNRESLIDNTLSSLNNEKNAINSSISSLQDKIAFLDDWLQKNANNDQISVDAIIVPTSALSNQ